MRLKYEVVKGLCQLMTTTCIKIRDTKNISVNLKRLRWSDKEIHLTLKDYQYHFTDYCNTPNTLLLDEVIYKLDELVKSKSKIADYDELKSDMEWLKEYYDEESWNDVTRWLTNIDSTLRETFSHYMEALKTFK
jgi:hypothetical protein